MLAAEQVSLGRRVAVKVLLDTDPESGNRRRMLREAKELQRSSSGEHVPRMQK